MAYFFPPLTWVRWSCSSDGYYSALMHCLYYQCHLYGARDTFIDAAVIDALFFFNFIPAPSPNEVKGAKCNIRWSDRQWKISAGSGLCCMNRVTVLEGTVTDDIPSGKTTAIINVLWYEGRIMSRGAINLILSLNSRLTVSNLQGLDVAFIRCRSWHRGKWMFRNLFHNFCLIRWR